jgi:hypothetical protein
MGHPGMLRCNASPSARFLRCLLTHLSALRELLECALPTGRRMPLPLALPRRGGVGRPLTSSAGPWGAGAAADFVSRAVGCGCGR